MQNKIGEHDMILTGYQFREGSSVRYYVDIIWSWDINEKRSFYVNIRGSKDKTKVI